MKRPVGIAILALSFVAAALFVVGLLHWYWITEPNDSLWHPVQLGLGFMFAVGVGAIGIGLLELSSRARWTAFFCLAALFCAGVPATLFDLFAQRNTWLAVDLMLLTLFAMPCGYLLTPAVSEAFTARR